MDEILIVKENGEKTVLLTERKRSLCLKIDRFGIASFCLDLDEKDLELIYECLKEWKYPETF